MHAADLLAELGLVLGLPTLRLSEMGTATLVVDDELRLNLEHDEDAGTLWASIDLGEPPAQEREALYAQLLQANLYGQGSGGGAVALDATRHALMLGRAFALEHTDAQALESGLAALIGAARSLREAWTQPVPQAARPADAGLSFPLPGQLFA